MIMQGAIKTTTTVTVIAAAVNVPRLIRINSPLTLLLQTPSR
jgi:hypothetical protein